MSSSWSDTILLVSLSPGPMVDVMAHELAAPQQQKRRTRVVEPAHVFPNLFPAHPVHVTSSPRPSVPRSNEGASSALFFPQTRHVTAPFCKFAAMDENLEFESIVGHALPAPFVWSARGETARRVRGVNNLCRCSARAATGDATSQSPPLGTHRSK